MGWRPECDGPSSVIRLVERTHVPASPEQVWTWFVGVEAHYRDWHPEHVEWRILSGTPATVGAAIFLDEWIGWFRLAMRCRITEARPNRFFRYEAMLPYSLVGVGGSFALEPVPGGCELLAEVHIGWPIPVLGPLIDRLIAAVFPLPELRRHMAEEGQNLARIPDILQGP